MKRHVAISALGKDRPGIVAAFSKVLYETGCNIEDSSMTLLASEFAMILVAALPEDLPLAALRRRLVPVTKKLGLTVSLKTLTSAEERHHGVSRRGAVISVYGADKPGIVHRVSDFLAGNEVNITDVQTNISGGIYLMLLEVDLPRSLKFPKLSSALARLAKELNVSITANPLESPIL